MDEFVAEVAREDLRLARACLLLARDARPALDPGPYLARFDEYAARVREHEHVHPFPVALRAVLAEEEGYRGAFEDYYDPEHSLLDAVMDRRRGLPIMLSIVWLEVARRLDEPLVGVGMPGHFLVRHEDTLLDPFHGGGVVTEDAAQEMLDRIYGGGVRLTPALLAPTSDRDVLARVLSNLKNAYLMAQDAASALRVEERILALNPFALEEYRDRGLLRRALGDVDGAREDLSRYLSAMPRAPDAEAVRRLLARL